MLWHTFCYKLIFLIFNYSYRRTKWRNFFREEKFFCKVKRRFILLKRHFAHTKRRFVTCKKDNKQLFMPYFRAKFGVCHELYVLR